MKCPFCAAWSTVLETRERANNVTWRKHRCANEHEFASTQTVENRDVLIARRNRQIVDAVTRGKSMTEVAKAFGMRSHSEVSRILAKFYPSFEARANGQRRAWSTTRRRKGEDQK